MTSHSTREFMALCSIAQHFGRPGVPTDQAQVETLWGHVKADWPHLCSITDPAVLSAELERVRNEYNTVHLHEAIGYVTPVDEHEGRGDTIRQAASTDWHVPPRPAKITAATATTTARTPSHDEV